MGAILVAFVLVNVLLKGTGGSSPTLPPIAAPSGSTSSGTPSVAPSATNTPAPPTVPPGQNFTGRDPFSVPPALQPSASGGSTSPPSSGPPPSGSTPPPTSTSTTPPPSNPGGGSSIVIGGHTVVLLDTFRRGGTARAQVEVDGVVYSVAVGQTFAGGQFQLRSTSGNCATFDFGDQPFALCFTASK
jgi:hypothetical protein